MLGMACPGAAQVITLTDRPVPCGLVNMESVLMICLVCLGREASLFCVMHTLDTIRYSATPLSLSPGDTVFLSVEKHWMLQKLCPGINFFAALPFLNLRNAPLVPDDSCWSSKHLQLSSVTWSDLRTVTLCRCMTALGMLRFCCTPDCCGGPLCVVPVCREKGSPCSQAGRQSSLNGGSLF